MKKHNLFPEKVFLDEETHKYFDTLGQRYMGFSEFSEFFIKKFDSEMISRVVAKSEGVSKDSILDKWQEKTDNGSRIDKALELTAINGIVPGEYSDIAELVLSVLKEYKDYHSCYEQVVTYNEHYRIAGSPDKFMLTSARKDGSFKVSDFKVFEKDDLHIQRGWMLPPFTHLPNTKFHKIAFQTSYYAFQLEHLLNKRCSGLFIHLIDPINKTHSKVHVPYLRNDIQLCLEMKKEEILSSVTSKAEHLF